MTRKQQLNSWIGSNPAEWIQVQRYLARNSLLAFTQWTFKNFKLNWHHSVVARYLDDVLDGKIPRLIIQAPPRHSKTEMVQRRFPAYALARHPDMNIIGASYAATLANRTNRDIQRIIESRPYKELFPRARIPEKGWRGRGEKRTNEFFEMLGRGGSYRSTGTDGGITGLGFDIGLIDDPFKNRAEAESSTIRDNVWEWYTSTFYTRRDADSSAIVIIMTRWHEDDLVGRLLAAQQDGSGDKWVVLDLPGLALEQEQQEPYAEDVDPRQPGDALWPDKFDAGMLTKLKGTIGSYDFESLYQQRPYPSGGAKIKRFWFEGKTVQPSEVPHGCLWVRAWDFAVSKKQSADHTVGIRVGFDVLSGKYFISDIQRARLEWPETRRLIRMLALSKPGDLQVIGSTGTQKAMYDDLRTDEKLSGVNFLPVIESVDKLTRAIPWIAKAEDGKIYLVEGEWIDEFLTECARFTGSGQDKEDDQIDAMSLADIALRRAVGGGMIEMLPGLSGDEIQLSRN